MKNKNITVGKLSLNKTTLKNLQVEEMEKVNGGIISTLACATVAIGTAISYTVDNSIFFCKSPWAVASYSASIVWVGW